MTDLVEEDEPPIDNFPYIIFDAVGIENIPVGFNAVRIILDGTLQSDLNWKPAILAAEHYLTLNLKLFWEIDFGLFDRIAFDLNNSGPFNTLKLSLEHFQQTIWNHYSSHSIGLCLYRGTADFATCVKQNDIFEDADVTAYHTLGAEYLHLLSSSVSNAVPCYVLLDAHSITSPFLLSQMFNKKFFPRIHLSVKNGQGLIGELSWDNTTWDQQRYPLGTLSRTLPKQSDKEPALIGICLPELSEKANVPLFEKVFKHLEQSNIPYKIVSESTLNVEWDNLEKIVVQTDILTSQGTRMLNGFLAAGGLITDINLFWQDP